jgi:signal transduction histidine kinase/Tfp pilus assembly protein PilF
MIRIVLKKLILFLLFFGQLIVVFPQKLIIDSLKQRVKYATEEEKIEIFNRLANLHLHISLKATRQYSHMALTISKELSNKKGEADALNRLGTVYYYFSDYNKAIEYYIQSLTIREKIDDQPGIAGSYNNIALIYDAFKDYDKALEYTLKSFDVNKALGDKEKMAANLNNLGVFYSEKKNNALAFDSYQKSLDLYKEINNKQGIADVLNNLGDLYRMNRQYNEALSYLQQSIRINEELNDFHSIATSKITLAEIYSETQQYDLAYQNLKEGLSYAKEFELNDLIRDIYGLMASYYVAKNNYKNAFEYHQLYTQLNDSIFNKKSSDQIADMQVRFESENKDREIQLLKQKENIRKLHLKRNKNQINYLILSSILILILGIAGFQSFRIKKDSVEILRKKNVEYYHINHELTESQSQLQELNSTKDKFFSIISHDLINPFQSLMGFTEILNTTKVYTNKAEIRKICKIINLVARNLYNLLENLLQWTLAQTDKLTNEPKKYDAKKLISSVESLFKISLKEKKITLISDIEANTYIHVDKNIFQTVMRNLVSNAIKFSREKGQIVIRSRRQKSKNEFAIIDNGIGITEEHRKNLFNFKKTYSTKGTLKEEGTGLGLILCKEFIEKMGGSLKVKSTPGKGSIFSFNVPVLT